MKMKTTNENFTVVSGGPRKTITRGEKFIWCSFCHLGSTGLVFRELNQFDHQSARLTVWSVTATDCLLFCVLFCVFIGSLPIGCHGLVVDVPGDGSRGRRWENVATLSPVWFFFGKPSQWIWDIRRSSFRQWHHWRRRRKRQSWNKLWPQNS